MVQRIYHKISTKELVTINWVQSNNEANNCNFKLTACIVTNAQVELQTKGFTESIKILSRLQGVKARMNSMNLPLTDECTQSVATY